MTETVHHPYQRGFFYETMPIAPVEENCTEFDAGPLRLVVESRHLTNELLFAALPDAQHNVPAGTTFDDSGPTVHVLDSANGLEHLRFDCFEHEPHYHYVMHALRGNLVCRIDEVAVGDPVAWTIDRLRGRLPEMLELSPAHPLAVAVRAAAATVATGVERVVELLERASGGTGGTATTGGAAPPVGRSTP